MISTWIDEIDLQLKAYDIVCLTRDMNDLQVQASMIHVENVNITPEVESLRMLENQNLRYKALSWGDAQRTEKLWKVRTRNYTSHHRDN